jgi:flagellin
MGLRIQNNVEAFNSHRNLVSTAGKAAKAMEKLSSGYRINRAADDAAGLAISEKMRAQIGGLTQASRNAQDGVSLVQTAEGALNEVHAMIQRVRDLKVQYSNGTLSNEDKKSIVAEAVQLSKEIKDIGTTTEFNGISLLNGDGSGAAKTVAFQVGANQGETISVTVGALAGASGTAATGSTASAASTASGPGVDGVSGNADDVASAASTASAAGTAAVAATGAYDVLTLANAASGTDVSATTDYDESTLQGAQVAAFEAISIDSLDTAINNVSQTRSDLGAVQNRLEHRLQNIATYQENLVASESRIRDVDMAAEMVNFTKLNILQQAGTSMLSQANQAPQSVLSLLR